MFLAVTPSIGRKKPKVTYVKAFSVLVMIAQIARSHLYK